MYIDMPVVPAVWKRILNVESRIAEIIRRQQYSKRRGQGTWTIDGAGASNAKMLWADDTNADVEIIRRQ